MVLWEITLATAYFLGLKRTYRLALKIQRRLISPEHPKIREFAHRRTRAIFDMALKVHRNIQERNIEVGRNLGNWILRWLDKMKPSANIRGASSHPQEKPPGPDNLDTSKTNTAIKRDPKNNNGEVRRYSTRSYEQGCDRHLFSTTSGTLPKSFPSIDMITRPSKPAGNTTQYRQLCINGHQLLTSTYGRAGFEGVIRKDIILWMQRN